MKRTKIKNQLILLILIFITITSCIIEQPELSKIVKIKNNLKLSDINIKELKTRILKDPNWRVIDNDNNNFLAILRNLENGDFGGGAGYIRAQPFVDYHATLKVIIKTLLLPEKKLYKEKYNISYNSVESDSIEIKCYKENPKAERTSSISHIEIKKDNIFGIEIFESSSNIDREIIEELLLKLDAYINLNEDIYNGEALLQKYKSICNRYSLHHYGEFDLSNPLEVGYTFPHVNIIVDDQLGSYHGRVVDGYINTKQEGKLYLKVYNIETSEDVLLETDENNIEPLEYVGWSEDENERFYFEIPFAYKHGNIIWSNPEYNEKFELWFHPSDNCGDFIVYEEKYKNKLISKVDMWFDTMGAMP